MKCYKIDMERKLSPNKMRIARTRTERQGKLPLDLSQNKT